MPVLSLLGPFELKYVVLFSPLSVVPLRYPSAGKDESDSVTLKGDGLLQQCLHKNEEGTGNGQQHGESSPGGLVSSLCCPSECRRNLVASSAAVVYHLLSVMAPSSSNLGRARSMTRLSFQVEKVSVFVEGLQSEPQHALKPGACWWGCRWSRCLSKELVLDKVCLLPTHIFSDCLCFSPGPG